MRKPETPLLATDAVVRLWEKDHLKGLVLIERRYEPKGFALPGGFVEVGERVEEACLREVKEETGLEGSIVRLLGVYSDPHRDPRFHVVSVVFIVDAEGEPKAGDDAKGVSVFPLESLPFDRLVFDHKKILLDFLRS
ncbi:NUDIX hydrolase [Thermocrinis albus DSM 14484]|uniref:NUDIX hydrolase n=1 Tax=Thermocrinis albus (strain DSM 14484 / JCM 11386 / HI 11/12) TaxID=638303 RepID=D3SL14_THEAH|nr:NUDIX hydrolase [Thermocrinis albus]ADC89444.1 NUDIX hydrolase [Thermocrinis albus DSM 14484]